QVSAVFVGDRSRESARRLWRRIPRPYRERATFYSDDWEAYKGVIPPARHQVCGKESGLTSGVERFNCRLRQRVSRLVRKTLSFSKKLANHIGAIKYFICHYNREVIRLVCPALLFLTTEKSSPGSSVRRRTLADCGPGF